MASQHDRPEEKPAVRTTIVGGRPPGSGTSVGAIPRGVEVLVKKASVDPAFRELLLRDRLEAARSIGLPLTAAETMMLQAVPAPQLDAIISGTQVPAPQMPAFLGYVAALMLAAIGVIQAGCDDPSPKPAGIRPEPQQPPPAVSTTQAATQPANQQSDPVSKSIRPDVPSMPAPTGIRPDRPESPRPLPMPVAGILVEPQTQPSTQPATNPATQSAKPPVEDQRIIVLGIRPDATPPKPKPTDPPPPTRGIQPDRPRQ